MGSKLGISSFGDKHYREWAFQPRNHMHTSRIIHVRELGPWGVWKPGICARAEGRLQSGSGVRSSCMRLRVHNHCEREDVSIICLHVVLSRGMKCFLLERCPSHTIPQKPQQHRHVHLDIWFQVYCTVSYLCLVYWLHKACIIKILHRELWSPMYLQSKISTNLQWHCMLTLGTWM